MSASHWFAALRRTEWGELGTHNIGSWPIAVKTAVAGLVLLVALATGYNLYLSGSLEQLERKRGEEVQLKQQFASKARQAANLERYSEQLHVMQNAFGLLLRQLPSDTEVPGLLEDISRTGLGSGLEFEEIKLLPEVTRPFYIELPIQITVIGAYHDLATFVSGVSGLPRIVTLHDFEIKPLAAGDGSRLRMSIQARTYRYNGQEPQR